MNMKSVEAHDLVEKAREALRHGDKPSARQMGERAVLLAPEMENAWLILSTDSELLRYLKAAGSP